MTMNIHPTRFSRRSNRLPGGVSGSRRAAPGAGLEFGRFRVLLRRRQLLAEDVPVELGTRAFDLLLVLLEADGALVTKEELMTRVWPGIVVTEENIKFQVSILRKALGADRDMIRTEFGRGYRFIGPLRSNPSAETREFPARLKPRSDWFLLPQGCLRSFRSVNSVACTGRCRFSGHNTARGSTAWS